MTDRTDNQAPARRGGHRQALDLARLGRNAEALEALREHLLAQPLDGEALNDAGALLYGLGRYDEAARHLETALGRLPDRPGQTMANLLEAYLAAGRCDDAAALLGPLAKAGAIAADHVARTASALAQARGQAAGIEALLGALPLLPAEQAEALAPLRDRLRSARPTVGIVPAPGDEDPWPRALANFLGERFPTRALPAEGAIDAPVARGSLGTFLDRCRIVWLEGCSPQALAASRRRPAAGERPCRLIVHVTIPEAYGPTLDLLDTSAVDLLVADPADDVQAHLAARLPDLAAAGRIAGLRTGADAPATPLRDRPPGKHLACVDALGLHGNAMLLLHAFRRLMRADDGYRLSLAGCFGDDLLEAGVTRLTAELGLAHAVRFDGWQADPLAWLSDKDFLVSAGLAGPPRAVTLGALALGVRPVLHVSPGAREAWPGELLWSADEEFIDRLRAAEPGPLACRRLVEQAFPLRPSLARANELIVRVERQLHAPDEPRCVTKNG